MTAKQPNRPIPRSKSPASPSAEVQAPKPTVANTAEASQSVTTGAKPRDLDRDRARAAWNNIQAVKPQNYQAKYGSMARKMPTLIQTNGLGQTLAFLKAKGKEHHVQMFNHLSEWLVTRISGTGDMLNRVLEMESQTYRLATGEALAFLQWLKRFAEAELGNEEDN
jgi:CRISPR-associated protein Cmr5